MTAFPDPESDAIDTWAGTVTILMTDIEGSTRLWETEPGAMEVALQRPSGTGQASARSSTDHLPPPAEDTVAGVLGTRCGHRRGYAPRMRRVRVRAWVGTVAFLVLAPGVVAGLIPGLITGWRMPWTAGWSFPIAVAGGIAVLGGVLVLLDAFVRFARADGTPAPPMPTAHLVVVGPYRYVRNPMYLAVLTIILGQALLFRSGAALIYAGVVLLAVALFVLGYEEPTLESEYGDEYREYRRNVHGWIPRLRPWRQAGPRP